MCVALCRVSCQSCGTIGNSNDSELSENTQERFYLDINNEATCNGAVTSWTVCYYGPSEPRLSSYWATYAVCRRNNTANGEERYERVSGVLSAVRSTRSLINLPPTDGQIQNGGFMCYNDSVNTSDSPLTIQAGDIIGACVFDPQDGILFARQPLDIVDRMNGESLLQVDLPDDACTMDAIPSSILRSDLQNRNNRRLHIYANIEPSNNT